MRTIRFCSVVFGVTSSLAVIHTIHSRPWLWVQKVGTDFVQAMNDVGDMVSTLQSLRTRDAFHKLFQEASNVAETFLDCNITKPRTASRSVYRAAAAATAGDTAEDYYRLKCFILLLTASCETSNCASAQSRCPWIWATWFEQQCQLYSTQAAWKQLESGIAVYSDFLTPAMKSEFFFLWRRKWHNVSADDVPNLLFQRWTTVASLSTWNWSPSFSQHFQSQLQKRSVCSRRWRKLQRQFAQQWKRIGSKLFYFFKYTVTWLPSVQEVIDKFAATGSRRLKLKL